MILYHGSYVIVEKPDLSFSRINTDFGKGFYTTPYKDQARKWTDRIINRRGIAYISYYQLDDSALNELNILEFSEYSFDWLEFVAACRQGKPVSAAYDVIAGSVANDKVFDTLEEYFQGYRTKEEALKRLRYEKPNWQYCFKKQNVVDKYLRYIESEEITK